MQSKSNLIIEHQTTALKVSNRCSPKIHNKIWNFTVAPNYVYLDNLKTSILRNTLRDIFMQKILED